MIITNQELKERLGLFGISGHRNLQTEFFDIWCDSDYYSDALVEITKDSIILDVQAVSSTTTLAYPLELSFDNFETLSDLISEIEDYNGWSTILYVREDAASSSLNIQPEVSCLGYQNRTALNGEKAFWLDKVAARASDFVEDYCNRKFEESDFTEILSGNGEKEIRVSNYPVDAISEVEIRSDDEWQSIDSGDYSVDFATGTLYKKSSTWDDGFENYRVTYTGGYSTLPEALKDLTLEIAAVMWNSVGSNPKVSREKIGSYQTTFIEGFMTDEIKSRLSYWERKDL